MPRARRNETGPRRSRRTRSSPRNQPREGEVGDHLSRTLTKAFTMTEKEAALSTETTSISPALQQGRLQAWRARWFGERDAVADQLADIARQGANMARLAHVCASLMLVLFSAGS